MFFRLLLKIFTLIIVMLILSIVVIALVLFLCLWIIITEEKSDRTNLLKRPGSESALGLNAGSGSSVKAGHPNTTVLFPCWQVRKRRAGARLPRVLMAKLTKNAANYGANFAATAIIDCLSTSHTDICRARQNDMNFKFTK